MSGTTFQVKGSHVYAEAGLYAVLVTINDAGGTSVPVLNTKFNVGDAGLTATAKSISPVEGQPLANVLVATFTDANHLATLADFPPANVAINWGDGGTSSATSITQPGGVGTTFDVYGSHTYAEEGAPAKPLTVRITDVHGSVSNTTSYAVSVKDAPLTAVAMTVPKQTSGVPFTVELAQFTDANPLAPLSDFPLANVTIKWGDGSTSNATAIAQPGGPGTPFDVYGTHTYHTSSSKTYSVTVAIKDIGGATKTVSTSIVDPPASAAPSARTLRIHTAALLAFLAEASTPVGPLPPPSSPDSIPLEVLDALLASLPE